MGIIMPEDLAKAGSEEAHQSAVMCWCALNTQRLPMLKRVFHVPNGGLRSKATASKMKAQGVKSGVPDIWFPYPMDNFHGLVIELKVDNKQPFPAQLDWLTYLIEVGYSAIVCQGWESARDTILDYLHER